jgi:DNA modification methylase
MLEKNRIHLIDANEGLKQLDNESVDCVVTSPPYWMTRDYGIRKTLWADHKRSILGLESGCDEYITHLLEIFSQIRRVLRRSGTLWVNLGDSYGGQSTQVGHARRVRGRSSILPEDLSHLPAKGHVRGRWSKCLMGVPERFVLGMYDQGWILRNRIVWHKPSHMPESVRDRFSSSWEYLFFFVKSRKYWFDLDAVREPHRSLSGNQRTDATLKPRSHRPSRSIKGVALPPTVGEMHALHPKGRNPADYWSIPPETRSHGAIMGERGATKIPGGSGWTGHAPGGEARILRERDPRWLSPNGKNPGDCWDVAPNHWRRPDHQSGGHFAIFPERLCERPILAGCPRGGLVLDPFMGSGTTAVVAKRLGRDFIGFELNPAYVKMAEDRLARASGSTQRKGGRFPESADDRRTVGTC